ncbi:adhesin [Pseudomonas sichuanensis]|uniref:adhesin n=1 Tax=Pseudomonas TaxID=286 RepID=UPI00244A3CCA|nr:MULTISPECIES: adhesin [Pseudomonas]MDH0730916.1 adhesin [Pseudomonas sichuanensis]MDH1581107.1 adhesin [Pseudomonas sichuanensis]MDH1591032.1 adhesin [Pseudomonas sichuanensis]MDH1596701.1 adhesin [Pseudomonas sichuanensis]MDU9403891.1 adhesin [Pseudomonas sp. zfem004]
MRHSLLILATLCSAPAFAQSPIVDTAIIDSSASQYRGNMAVNQAAGDFQQQANARALANGHSANATTQIRQRLQTTVDPARDSRASIQGDAFSHGSGVLGVNQSAGASTQQANALRISISAQPQSLDDSVLLQQNVALRNTSDATDSAPGYRQVSTSDQAFTGSRGVIQLNQSAGVGNRMANTLSVRVAE